MFDTDGQFCVAVYSSVYQSVTPYILLSIVMPDPLAPTRQPSVFFESYEALYFFFFFVHVVSMMRNLLAGKSASNVHVSSVGSVQFTLYFIQISLYELCAPLSSNFC